ncbi:LacI family DNA-binding transcriptional regulator [Dictyobacter arantiisoli]|uniref:LacI family transcriptional regulator n=1 Tax=Dictyobacter arantiisoli TaxID=2014874 RepID=A0A5A5TEG6_9CHLR|nr:LacI family DNA-binding transcriptional regulator [Dictyobacter arantiisoli]GCF09951.1 LacI family transcriptional regulator [Dictyobacter arantiisoli]
MVRGNDRWSVTSIDVARHAGVSQSTVSLVFAGKAEGRVSPLTQQKVLRIAEELGYRPNIAARTLRLGHTNIIAFVIPDVTNPFFAAVLKGAEQAARAHDYAVILVSTDNDQAWQGVVMDALTTHSIEGFVLCAVRPPDNLDLSLLRGRALIVDDTYPDLTALQLDIAGGTQAAMQHLIELGHRKIAHLASRRDTATFRLRGMIYEQTLSQLGEPIRAEYTAQAALEPEDALQAARQLLQATDIPTAIFCDDDLLAIGVYKAAREMELAIPGQLSVVGFGGGLIAQTLAPDLTTVAIPAGRLGEQALEILYTILNTTQPVASALMPLQLRIGDSTALPRP